MEPLSVVLLVFAVLYCIYHYFQKKLSYFEDLGVPSTPAWPLIGHTWAMIRRRKNILTMMQEGADAHADAKYYGVFMFTRPTIVITDLELVKTVGIKHFESFPDRTASVDVATADPFFNGSLFNMHGERWREARNLLSPAFTSSKLKGMFELMCDCGQTLIDYLATKSTKELALTDTKDLFTRYTSDVIATCAFGIHNDSLNDPDNQFYILGRKAANLGTVGMFKFFLQRTFPRFCNFFNIKFLDQRIINYFEKLVSDTITTREQKGIYRPDMIQLMMDARVKDNKHIKLDITEMTAQAFVFFFGGFESSAGQMCILAHELAIHTEVQAKLQEEIDRVLEITGGKPTYEAINAMTYLDAVWNESFRRHAPFPTERYCVKAFELPPALPGGKPVTIQPGTYVIIPGPAIHYDSRIYEDPRNFNPERYLNKKVTINDPTNMGFGIGPRACIGNRFAILETKVLFFYLLSKFNLRPSEKTCVPLEYEPKSLVIMPKGGFWVAIEPRN